MMDLFSRNFDLCKMFWIDSCVSSHDSFTKFFCAATTTFTICSSFTELSALRSEKDCIDSLHIGNVASFFINDAVILLPDKCSVCIIASGDQ